MRFEAMEAVEARFRVVNRLLIFLTMTIFVVNHHIGLSGGFFFKMEGAGMTKMTSMVVFTFVKTALVELFSAGIYLNVARPRDMPDHLASQLTQLDITKAPLEVKKGPKFHTLFLQICCGISFVCC